MKKTFLMFAIPVAMLSAQTVAPATGTAKKPAKPAVSQGPTGGIPDGAVQVNKTTYRFTDAKGVNWIYHQTPFGWSKSEDKPEEEKPVTAQIPTAFVDLGDSVKFTRPTPFGNTSWTKKKTALNDDEKAIVAGTQPDLSHAPSPVKPEEKK